MFDMGLLKKTIQKAVFTKTVESLSYWYLGFGLFISINVVFIWGALPFSYDPGVLPEDIFSIAPYRASIATSIAIFSFLIGLSAWKRPFSKHKQLAMFSTAAMIIGSAILIVTLYTRPSPALLVTAGVLLGFSHAAYFVLWGSVLGSLDPRSSLFAVLWSSALNGLLCLLLFLIPDQKIPYILTALSIPLAFISLQKCLTSAPGVSKRRHGINENNKNLKQKKFRALVKELWSPLLSVCVLAFLFNSTREIAAIGIDASSHVNVWSMVGLLLSIFIVLCIVKLSPSNLEIEKIYPYAAVIVAALIIPGAIVGIEYWNTINLLMSIIYLLVIMLFKTILAKVSYEQEIDPVCVFGFGYSINYVAMGAGTFVGMLAHDDSLVTIIPLAAVAVLFVYLLLFPLAFRKKKNEKVIIINAMDDEEIEARCRCIAANFGLTERELTTMKYLAQGLRYAAIAERLVVSENTVRTHSQAVYRKLGIHARHELTEMVEAQQSVHD